MLSWSQSLGDKQHITSLQSYLYNTAEEENIDEDEDDQRGEEARDKTAGVFEGAAPLRRQRGRACLVKSATFCVTGKCRFKLPFYDGILSLILTD